MTTEAGQRLLDHFPEQEWGESTRIMRAARAMVEHLVPQIELQAAKAERERVKWALLNGPYVTRTGQARKGGVPVVEIFAFFDELDGAP